MSNMSGVDATQRKTDPDAFVQNVMSACGWYEGRSTSVEEWVDILAAEGIPVFDAALPVLQEFGGLIIKAPWHYPDGFKAETTIEFDPVGAGSGDADRLEYWGDILQQKFYPLGYRDQWPLYIGEDSQIYMHGIEHGYLVGTNIREALRRMILGKGEGKEVFHILSGKRVDK